MKVDGQCSCTERGSPTCGPRTGSGPRPVRKRAEQQEVRGGQAKLHLPLPIARITTCTNQPPHPHEKIVFYKTGPWCQKGWGPLL